MADIDVINEAKRILANYGTDAHLYVAGVDDSSGYPANNFTDDAGTIPANVGDAVARVFDCTGGVDGGQTVLANRPILQREVTGEYYWDFNGTTHYLALDSAPIGDYSNFQSITIAGQKLRTGVSCYIFGETSTSDADPVIKSGVLTPGPNFSEYVQNNAAQGAGLNTVGNISTTAVAILTTRRTNGSLGVTCYIDLTSTGTPYGVSPAPCTTNQAFIGARPGRGDTVVSNWYPGKIYAFIVIKGLISNTSLRSLQSYVSLLSGGSIPPIEPTGITYRLTCESGSYSVTGQPATFKKVSHLTGTKGHYVVTGKTALLRRGHSLICAAGSYAITGRDAKLKRGYKALAETGSYAVAGQDVLLRISHKLTCETGSYLVEGQDAAFEYFAGGDAPKHFTLACAKGAYLTSGKPATLKRARTFKCDAGSYAITGKPLLFKFARKMPSETGHYAVSGNDAQFKHAHQLKLSTGIYNTFGKPANLIHVSGGQINYNLLCIAGSYLYQGKNAKLLHKTKSAKCGIYLEAYQPKTTINATQPNYQIIKECE